MAFFPLFDIGYGLFFKLTCDIGPHINVPTLITKGPQVGTSVLPSAHMVSAHQPATG